MSRFKLDKTQSPPVVIDTSTGSTLTIDEVYKRRWQTTDLTEGTELTFMLCEVEQHAWEKVHANKREGKPMTHHIDEAAQIIADAVGDAMLTDVAAQALADAGLLMPDLPAPDLSADDPKHQAKHRALWGGEAPNVWNKGLPHELTLQTFPSDPDVTMYRDLEPEDLFSPAEARQLAYALLAAANHAEEQP